MSAYHLLKPLDYLADSRPYLGETVGMEGRRPPGIDARPDSGPLRNDPEKDLVEDGPMKPAANGAVSESSTPRVATTPRGNEAPSLPTNVSDMSKSLAKTFGVYARGIVNTSQSISQNKAAKTRLRRSRKADEKWQSRYGDFAALEEMQSKNLVSSEKKSSKCEKALDAAKKSHKHATTQIASLLAQSAHGAPSQSSEPQGAKVTSENEGSSLTIERIKADMTRLRGDFEKLSTHSQRADIVMGKQKRLEGEFDELRSRLGKQTDRLEDEIRDKVSFSAVRAYDQDSAKLKLLVNKAEAKIAKLEKPEERVETTNRNFDTAAFAHRIDGLQTKVELLETTRLDNRIQTLENKIETLEPKKYDVEQAKVDNEAREKDLKDQIASLQALKTSNETTEMQFTELKKDLSQQTGEIRSITEVVFGDRESNEASLLDMIKDSQDDAKKFREMFIALNTTVDEHQEGIDNLKARFKGFKGKLTTSSANPTSADSELGEALVDIDQIKQDIARLNQEQEEKDDIVSKEVDRLDKEVIRQGDKLDGLYNTVNELQSRDAIHEDDPLLKSRSAQQMNERVDKIDERLTKQEDSGLKSLEDVNALKLQLQELSSKGLDSKNPSDDIQNLHGLLTQHRGLITNLIARVDKLWSPGQSPHSPAQSPQLTNGIMGTKGLDIHKIEALESRHKVIKQEVDGLQSNFQHFKQLTTDTTNNHETFIDSLRQRFDNLTTDHMIRHMIYHLQLTWPDHPANVQGQLNHLHQRQAQLDHDIAKSITQIRELDANTEARTQQLIVRSTEQKNLLEQTRKESQQRNVEQHTLHQQTKEDSQRRHIESLNLLQNATEDFQRKHTEQSKLLEESKQDSQQQNRVLGEEVQEKYTILEQDVRDHLGRIQNLQKGLQSIRTDHTTSVSDLSKTLKDVQFIIQNLGPPTTHDSTNGTTTTTTTTPDAALKEDQLAPLKSSLDTIQKRLDDVWDNFLGEMASTHSTLAAVNKNIDALNLHCGMEGHTSPATSHPGTAVGTPFRTATHIINLEDEDSPPTLDAPPVGEDDSPAQQLVVRGGSVSLGEHASSSPVPEPVSQPQKEHTPRPQHHRRDGNGSSDSEPVVRTLKRRRGRGRPGKGSVDNSPRARKSSRLA